MLTLYMYF